MAPPHSQESATLHGLYVILAANFQGLTKELVELLGKLKGIVTNDEEVSKGGGGGGKYVEHYIQGI